MNQQNKNTQFEQTGSDDFNVLNYLLANVRGLSPSSLAPAYLVDDEVDLP